MNAFFEGFQFELEKSATSLHRVMKATSLHSLYGAAAPLAQKQGPRVSASVSSSAALIKNVSREPVADPGAREMMRKMIGAKREHERLITGHAKPGLVIGEAKRTEIAERLSRREAEMSPERAKTILEVTKRRVEPMLAESRRRQRALALMGAKGRSVTHSDVTQIAQGRPAKSSEGYW